MASSVKAKQAAPPADPAATPMMRFEKALPKLPVNSLVETAGKWLETVRFCTTDPSPFAKDAGPTPEFLECQRLAEEFVSSPVTKELQKRLLARAEQEDNWLSDWWNHYAYFSVRDPLCSANYFYAHADDKSRRTPALRAASLVRALLFFRRLVETGVLEPEMVRTTPLAMGSYEYLFNACRYPGQEVDTARKFDPEAHNHIVVSRHGKFYEVPIVKGSGEYLSQADLEAQFNHILQTAGSKEVDYPIGALTTDDRTKWAIAREELVKSSVNAKNLERIESAIVVLCLDAVRPVTRDQISWNLWIGDNHFNRWMDKHSLIVTDNAKSGFNGEHGNMDGTPTSRLNDWMLRALQSGKVDLGSPEASADLPAPKELTFELTDTVKRAIDSAKNSYAQVRAEHEMTVLHYDGYGKNTIKKFKTSPDSWAQLVIQLAYYKMEGHLAGTYESAQTRKFKLGRTEVIRSATAEALAWCKAMENPDVPDLRRLELLRKAANAHINYAQMAAEGKGVDRHFFGLKQLLKPGEELPDIYKHPAFATASTWILSTSNLGSENFFSWGFMEVVDNGFGIAYSVNNDSLRFCINTKTGKARTLHHYLQEAATEIKELFQKTLTDDSGLGRAPAKL